MENQITVFKSTLFQTQVDKLSVKESNLAFKKCRTLCEMLKNDLNTEHLAKVENENFELPLFALKINKNTSVLLSLVQENQNCIVHFLQIIPNTEIKKALHNIDTIEKEKFSFKFFWNE